MGKKISQLNVQNIMQHNRTHKLGGQEPLHGNYLSFTAHPFTAHPFPRQPPQQSCTLLKGSNNSLLISKS